MHTKSHSLIGAAARIPMNKARPIVSFSPVVLPTPTRPAPLQLRVTFPATGDALPIILLSHGHGRSNYLSSLEGYAPLYEFWAAHGFAVLQPTHMSSAFIGMKGPQGNEMYWQDRPEDMVRILDQVDTIESTVPGLQGRLDRSRIAVAGHSLGAFTASLLLGLKNTDPRDGSVFGKLEPRIKAGVILTGVGKGGDSLSESGQAMVPFFGPDFSTMTAPALVVIGEEDVSPHLTSRGADWHADSYSCAPGPKELLTIKGGKHGLGGISGWDAGETGDESPERLGAVQRLTWAYLMGTLYEGNESWHNAKESMKGLGEIGWIDSKA